MVKGTFATPRLAQLPPFLMTRRLWLRPSADDDGSHGSTFVAFFMSAAAGHPLVRPRILPGVAQQCYLDWSNRQGAGKWFGRLRYARSAGRLGRPCPKTWQSECT